VEAIIGPVVTGGGVLGILGLIVIYLLASNRKDRITSAYILNEAQKDLKEEQTRSKKLQLEAEMAQVEKLRVQREKDRADLENERLKDRLRTHGETIS